MDEPIFYNEMHLHKCSWNYHSIIDAIVSEIVVNNFQSFGKIWIRLFKLCSTYEQINTKQLSADLQEDLSLASNTYIVELDGKRMRNYAYENVFTCLLCKIIKNSIWILKEILYWGRH